MIDPRELAELPLEQRERIAFQMVADAARQAADLIGPGHPRFAGLDEAAGLFDQRPFRSLEGLGRPSRRDRLRQPPLLRRVK